MRAATRQSFAPSVRMPPKARNTFPASDEAGGAGRCERLEPRLLLAATLPDGFVESTFVAGVNTPVAMEFAPDGRLFIAEKAGVIRVANPQGKLRRAPFLSLQVDTFRERGLESFAFDPNFAENGFVYVYYSRADDNTKNRLSRFTVSTNNPHVADPNSETIILDDIPTPTGFHNGGAMHFGSDGMLYLGIGDGGSLSGDAQDLSKLSGKILRLNVSAYPDIIPDDNPFVNTPNARGEVYALGFRNPFTSAFDPEDDRFFVNDVGTNLYEEVNQVTAGKNYGWPILEGPERRRGFVRPIYSYPRGENDSAAITGGAFYRASQFPENFDGGYFFADYTQGWIKLLKQGRRARVFDFANGAEGPIDLDVGPDGSLYYLSAFGDGYSGENRPVMKISYVGGRSNRAPRAVASANATSGSAPLTVEFTAGRSSDPDGDQLTYTWDFGDGSDNATGRDVTHTFNANGSYNVILTVTDSRGASSTADPIRISVGSQSPTATITVPRDRRFYVAGQTIQFAGHGTDAEDGDLPASAYEWKVVFRHLTHTHPFIDSIPGVDSGSFTIPLTGETDPRQGYFVYLTVTDSDGLKDTASVYLRPRKAAVNVETNIPGLTIHLDDQPQTTPISFVGVAGMERKLSAPLTQTLNGKAYEFVSWSDGQDAEHLISTPRRNTTYTAEYREVTQRRRKRFALINDTPPSSSQQQNSIKTSDLAGILKSNLFSRRSISDWLRSG